VNRFIKIALLCVLAAAANFALNTLFILGLRTPLYLAEYGVYSRSGDTAAVCGQE
jgi:hypothetical protein